ncbi:hypothetical protein OK006_0167, partial [Actinobacteria bacterium OK006]
AWHPAAPPPPPATDFSSPAAPTLSAPKPPIDLNGLVLKRRTGWRHGPG